MTREHRSASRSVEFLSLLAAIALTTSCRQSSLPPLADDAEVAESASAAGEPLVIGEAIPQYLSPRTISLDGEFGDWAELPPVAYGRSTYEGSPFVRLGRIWTTFDAQWVYFRIELGRLVNVQGLTGTLSIQLDADGNRLTGDIRTGGTGEVGIAGIDFELHFSPRGVNGGFGGVGAEVVEAGLPTAPANPYWFGASFAPTYASDQIEMRLARGGLIPGATVMPFTSPMFSARVIFTNEVGSIIDRTAPFSIALPAMPSSEMLLADAAEEQEPAGAGAEPVAPEAPPSESESVIELPVDVEVRWATPVEVEATPTSERYARIARLDRRDVRALSWNVWNGAMFTNPGPFSRVARAIDPDIICFQELGSRTTESTLRSWLNEHLPTNFGWEVVISPDQGVGVASRLSSVAVTSISGLDGPDAPRLRAASLLVAAANRRILVTSAHLKCCGRIGDSSDQKRVAEASAMRRRLRAAQFDLNPSGLLIMGDLNLVGSYEPLQIIKFQNDLNATDLLVANPLVRGDTTNITWRDPEQPYLPGRLDYALISDAVFQVSQSFVLDTERLSDEELASLGLLRDDSVASDHLPLVMDFR